MQKESYSSFLVGVVAARLDNILASTATHLRFPPRGATISGVLHSPPLVGVDAARLMGIGSARLVGAKAARYSFRVGVVAA